MTMIRSHLNRALKLCRLVSCICLLSVPTLAQEEDVDFSEMSLEDLLNVEVSVASTKVETIIETPAVVSRVNQEDARRMGLTTLKEMLSMLPGFNVTDAIIGTTPIMVRGISDGFNQKILFLVDGIPYYQSTHSIDGLLGVPIDAVSHIEVIRGPGAVIYGTNASGGVVNVVTKKGDQRTVSASFGSNSHINASGYLSHSWSEDTSISFSFETQEEDGYDGLFQNMNPAPPFFPADLVVPTTGTITKYEEMTSFMLKFNHKKLNILLEAHESDRSGLASFTTLVNRSVLTNEGELLHIDYTHEWDSGSVKFYGDYNRFHLFLPTERSVGGVANGGFRMSDDGDDNYRQRLGVHANFNINENFTIFAGAETEERSSGDYDIFVQSTGATSFTLFPSTEGTEDSLFAQADYTKGDWRFLIGARYTDNEQSGDDTTPRASVVYKIDDKQSIKALYSVGFNSPNFLQAGILLPNVITGDPNIQAETVTAIDLAYSYSANNTLFVANLFVTEGEEFIGREARPPLLGAFYYNQEPVDRTGAEIDYQKATENWKFFGNLGYLSEGGDVDALDPAAFFAPQYTLALGGNYMINEQNSIGGSVRYLDDRGNADALTILNATYQYKAKYFEFFLTGKNITDEDIVNPDVQDFNVNRLVPGGDGANFLAGAKIHF